MKTGASDAPSQFVRRIAPLRPSIPLASSHLLINGPRDHTVSSEIKRELASSDRVDLLVSFLKWLGWRLLRDEARRFLDRHPGGICRQIMPTPRILAVEAPHARIRPDHV